MVCGWDNGGGGVRGLGNDLCLSGMADWSPPPPSHPPPAAALTSQEPVSDEDFLDGDKDFIKLAKKLPDFKVRCGCMDGRCRAVAWPSGKGGVCSRAACAPGPLPLTLRLLVLVSLPPWQGWSGVG